MWLQELPDTLTKITWDNVGLISPATAKALSLESGDTVRLTREAGLPIDVAVWIQPGQADNSIGLTLGWGRQVTGRYGAKARLQRVPIPHDRCDGLRG